MKNILKAIVTVVFFSDLLAAQSVTVYGGGRSSDGRIYDEKTFTQVKGSVASVEEVEPGKGGGVGIHFTLKTENESVTVHLGPKWYLEKQGFRLRVGDKVEVKGSRVVVGSEPAIIAREVVRDGKILRLRDKTGIPVRAGKANK